MVLTGLSGLSVPGQPGKNTGEIITDGRIRSDFSRGMLYLYNFEFNNALQVSEQLKTTSQASPWGFVLEANVLWWKLITGENNPVTKKQFFEALKLSDNHNNTGNIDEKLYCQIITNSLRSRYELLNKNYFSTLVILNKSKKNIKQMQGKENEYEPFLLTQGLFQYFIAVAKEKTGLLSYLLEYKTDKQMGLDCLNRLTHSENKVLRTESNYFLMKIYLEIEKDPLKAKPYADYLVTWYPGNFIFCYYNQMVNTRVYGKTFVKYDIPACSGKVPDPAQLTENQIFYLNSLSAQNK